MKNLKILSVIILCLFLVGCPATHQPVGPDGKPIMTEQEYYDEALGWWYDTEQNFKLYVYGPATPEEQKEMLPYLKILYEAKQVLNMWQLKITGGQPTHTQIQSWKEYKNRLIMMAANEYKERKNGG